MQFRLAFFLAAISISTGALAVLPISDIYPPSVEQVPEVPNVPTIPSHQLKHPTTGAIDGETSAFVSRDSVPALGIGSQSSNDPKALIQDGVKQVGGLALGQVKGTIQGYLSEVGTGVRTAKQLEAFLPAGVVPPLPVKKRALGDIEPVESLLGQGLIQRGLDPNELKGEVLSAPELVKADAAQVVQQGQSTVAGLQQQVQDAPAKAETAVQSTQAGLKQGSAITQKQLGFGTRLTESQVAGALPQLAGAIPDSHLKRDSIVKQEAALTKQQLGFGTKLTEAQAAGALPQLAGAVPASKLKRDTILPAFSLFPGAGPGAVELKNQLKGLTGNGGTAQGLNAPSGGAAAGPAGALTGVLGGAKRMEKVKRTAA